MEELYGRRELGSGCTTREAVDTIGKSFDIIGGDVSVTRRDIGATGDVNGNLVVDNPPSQAQHA